MLCKNILVRHRNRTFLCQTNSSYHSNQQLQTCNNQQVWMYSIQCNPLICNSRSCFPRISPKRVRRINRRVETIRGWQWKSLKRTLRKWLHLCSNRCKKQTKSQNTSNRVSPTLMCKDFSGRNIQEHNNKQKQNSKCPYINQQLQQNKIFKSLQNQKTRTMQKQQYQIKNRVYRVLRSHHLKNRSLCTCSYQSKRLTHKKVHFLPLLKTSYFAKRIIEFEGT